MNDNFLLMIQTALETKGVKADYNKLKQMFEKDPTKINAVMDMSATKTEINKFIKEYAPQLQKMFKDIGVDVNLKDLESSMKNVFKNTEQSAKKSIDSINKAYDDFHKKNISDYDLEIKKREEDAKIASNQIKAQMQERVSAENKIQAELKQTAKDQQNAFNLKSGKIQLGNQITTYMSQNTKATKKFGVELSDIQKKLKNVDNVTDLKNLKKDFVSIKSEATALGITGQTAFKNFTNDLRNFTTFLGAGTVIMSGLNTVRSMITNVEDLNKAYISLRKVTNETDDSYSKFLDNAAQKAKSLGSSISDIVNMTAEWAKAGYNLEDSAKLADVSTIFTNVGDVDASTAVSDIVTPMKAFNIEASNAIDIVNKLNEVDNNFSVSSADLGDGLKNSASALALAGNDINETIAMITGGSEITQNASEQGNALKVLSMRLRGMKGDLEKLGEEYDNVESVSKIQTHILNLTKGQVNIMNSADPTKFKSTYEIMKDISKVYDKLSQTNQADLLETIAGKQRGNQVAAILNAFKSGQVDKALETSINSQNSALNEQQKYMQGIEYSMDRIKASFQELSSDTVNSSWIKGFIDLSNVLLNVTDKIGIFNMALVVTAGILGGKGILMIPQLATWIGGLIQPMLGVSAASGALAGTMGAALSVMLPVLGVIAAYEGFDYLNKSIDRTIDKANKLQQVFNDKTTALQNNNQWIQSNADKYEELSKGVDSLGKNISLTDEEFKEHNTLANQIADMFPSLVTGYTDTGTAILTTKDNVDALTQAYKEQKQATQDAIITGATDSFKGFVSNTSQTDSGLKNVSSLENRSNLTKSVIDNIKNAKELENLLFASGQEALDLNTMLENSGIGKQGFFESNDAYIKRVQDNLQKLSAYYRTTVSDLNNETKKIVPVTNAFLDSNSDFSKLGSDLKTSIKQVVDNLGYDFYSKFKDDSELQSWIDNISYKIKNNKDLQNAFTDLFSLDKSKMSASLYSKQVNGLIKEISKELNVNPVQLKIQLGLETDNNLLKQIKKKFGNGSDLQKYINTLSSDDLKVFYSLEPIQGGSVDDYKNAMSDASATANQASNAIESSFSDAFNADSFSKSKNKLIELSKAGKLTEDTLSSTSEYQKLLEDTGLSAKEAVDYINKVAKSTITLSDAMSKLSTDQDLMSNLRKEIKDVGSISIDSLQKIISTYSELEPAVNDYLAGKMSEKTLLKKMQSAYQDDVSKYKTAVFDKMSTDKTFYNDMLKGLDDNVKKLATKYGIDLSNYTSYQASKLGITQKYQDAINDLQNVETLNSVFTSPFGTAWSETNAENNVTKKYKKKVTEIEKVQKAMNKLATNYKKSITVPKSSSTLTDDKNKNKTSEDKWLEKYNTAKEKLDYLHDIGKVSDEKYYKQLGGLRDKYLTDSKKHQEKYKTEIYSVNKSIYDGEKTLRENAIKEQFDDLEYSYNMGKISEEKYQKKRMALADKYYKNNKDHLSDYQSIQEDYYKWQKEQIEANIEKAYKKQSDAIDKIIDKYNDLRDAIKNLADTQKGTTQFNTLSGGIEETQREIAYYENQIKKLEVMKKAGAFTKGSGIFGGQSYDDMLSKLQNGLDSAKSALDDFWSSISENVSDEESTILDSIETGYDKFNDALEKEKDAYADIIDAQKELLELKKDEADYAKTISEKTKSISQIESRMAELQKAAQTGDRNAQKELSGLQDDLAKDKEDLSDTQADHEYDLQTKALDKALDDNNKIMDAKIEAAKTEYETQKANIQSLYEQTIELTKNASQYTIDQYNSAIDSIASKMAQNGVIWGDDYVNKLKDDKANSVTSDSSGLTDSQKYAVSSILNNGQGTGAGSSELNKYIKSNYDNQISYDQMAQLASIFGISGVTASSIVKDTDTKNEILDRLKKAGFSTGGTIGKLNGSGLLSELIKSSGDNVLIPAKTGEGVLTNEQNSAWLKLVPQMNNLSNIFGNLATPNLSNVVTNNTNNSSPVINVTIPVSGSITPATATTMGNNIANQVAKAIIDIKRTK